MSMLSAQQDRLRARASELHMFADGLSAPYLAKSTKKAMHTSMVSAAQSMSIAADTIWELRNDCVELRKERDELKKLADAQALDLECMTFNRDTLHTENANLRALCHDMYQYTTNREMELCNACVEADGDFADCAACDDYDGACGIAKRRFEELYQERMRELGIEVE